MFVGALIVIVTPELNMFVGALIVIVTPELNMFVGALIVIVTRRKYVCWCFDCHRHTGVNYVC